MEEIGNGNVKLAIDGHRADVILNRPEKRNAMNQALLSDLHAALTEVDANTDIRAMTLLGEGDIFCAGMDLEMMRDRGDGGGPNLDIGLGDITDLLESLSVPSVAGLKGAAIAGAFELVLPVDFRILSQDAKYGVIEVKLGVFPSGGATQRLPRLIGLSKAKELVLTGEYIDPHEAEQIGLVHEVVDGREETDTRARKLANSLAENAPLGMQYARQCLNAAHDMPLDEGLALESTLGNQLVHTDDYTEGFTARLEGRNPNFKGK